MKKIIMLCTLCVGTVFISQVEAQKFRGLDKSPMDAATYPGSYRVSDKTVKIIYSRPQLKGRSVSDLAPAGKVWRTGANEAPEITFYKDVTLGGKSVKAGTYSLLTIPGNDEWTVILSSDINVWGAYSYDEKNDVARVSGKVSQGESLEAFSITFDDDGNMHMGWGIVRIMVPMG